MGCTRPGQLCLAALGGINICMTTMQCEQVMERIASSVWLCSRGTDPVDVGLSWPGDASVPETALKLCTPLCMSAECTAAPFLPLSCCFEPTGDLPWVSLSCSGLSCPSAAAGRSSRPALSSPPSGGMLGASSAHVRRSGDPPRPPSHSLG